MLIKVLNLVQEVLKYLKKFNGVYDIEHLLGQSLDMVLLLKSNLLNSQDKFRINMLNISHSDLLSTFNISLYFQ